MNLLFQLTPCPLCKTRSSTAKGCCEDCAAQLFAPIINTDEIVLGVYQGNLEKAVRALKYHHVSRLGALFGHTLAQVIRHENWQLDGVCAVPLHWRRQMQRGYNQAALIAKPLARQLAVPYLPVLKRTRYTKQQAKLSLSSRKANVAGAFKSSPLKGEHILLIDDVLTTGMTLQEAKQALLKAGAKSVKLASVAKAIKRP